MAGRASSPTTGTLLCRRFFFHRSIFAQFAGAEKLTVMFSEEVIAEESDTNEKTEKEGRKQRFFIGDCGRD
jgi:hypothetical protein